MGDHRLPKRAMSGELEDVGRRGRRRNRRTALQRMICYMASHGTGAPVHLTPGFLRHSVYEGDCRFMATRVAAEEKRNGRGGQG